MPSITAVFALIGACTLAAAVAVAYYVLPDSARSVLAGVSGVLMQLVYAVTAGLLFIYLLALLASTLLVRRRPGPPEKRRERIVVDVLTVVISIVLLATIALLLAAAL